MPYPAGVVTRIVTLPLVLDAGGNPASGVLVITPSLTLKWAATSQIVLDDPITTNVVGGVASVSLPVVQSGFVLSTNVRVDAWVYNATLSLAAGITEPPAMDFVLPVGVGDYILDFDAPAPVSGTVIATIEHDIIEGAAGPVTDLIIGTVTAGATAGATIRGTAPTKFLDLVLPTGPAGSPGSVVGFPIGGTVGQLARKKSLTDYDVEWFTPTKELPTGGTTGQVLAKTSGTSFDVQWIDPPASSGGGGGGGTTLDVLYSGGAYPVQAAAPPAGIKVRRFYGPVQYAGATWPGVLDDYLYAELT